MSNHDTPTDPALPDGPTEADLDRQAADVPDAALVELDRALDSFHQAHGLPIDFLQRAAVDRHRATVHALFDAARQGGHAVRRGSLMIIEELRDQLTATSRDLAEARRRLDGRPLTDAATARKLAGDAIGLYREYLYEHDYTMSDAAASAIAEVVQGATATLGPDEEDLTTDVAPGHWSGGDHDWAACPRCGQHAARQATADNGKAAEFTFTVRVTAGTRDQAEQVMTERIGHDEDYGFDYRIDWDAPPRDRVLYTVTASDADHIAGHPLTDEEHDAVADSIGHSSIPEALATVIDGVTARAEARRNRDRFLSDLAAMRDDTP